MPTKKTPARATLAIVFAALLVLPLLPGATVGQTTDGVTTKDPTPIARAATGNYFRVGLGLTSLVGYDEGIALTAALGDHAVFDRFRGEVELSFASVSDIGFCEEFRCYDNGVRTLALTANAYYDYHNRTAWTPFAGLGVGIESEAYSGVWNRGRRDRGAWRGRAHSQFQGRVHGNLGVAYAATDDLAVQLAWRAFGQTGADQGWFHAGVRLNR